MRWPLSTRQIVSHLAASVAIAVAIAVALVVAPVPSPAAVWGPARQSSTRTDEGTANKRAAETPTPCASCRRCIALDWPGCQIALLGTDRPAAPFSHGPMLCSSPGDRPDRSIARPAGSGSALALLWLGRWWGHSHGLTPMGSRATMGSWAPGVRCVAVNTWESHRVERGQW